MDPWKFLDDLEIKVFCICLKSREDRYVASREQFENVKLISRVKYYRPIKEKTGRAGCWHSHKKLIQSFGHKKLLIFEDDVVFSGDWYTQLGAIETFLRTKQNWDIFRLGACVLDVLAVQEHTSLVDCFYLHAYFIHENYSARILRDKQYSPRLHKTVYNDYYHRMHARNYVLNNQICFQDDSLGSDNGIFSRLFRYLSGKIRYAYNPFFWALYFFDFIQWARYRYYANRI